MTRADELYHLLDEQNIIGQRGQISFSLGEVDVAVEDVSVVGNILQEWLANFMRKNQFYYREKENTQEFPDFLLNRENSDFSDLLEVKAFTGSPNFDVANFRAYARSLRKHAYRLDAKYLIFKYSTEGANVVIDKIWLKNVWEICGGSHRSLVKIQWKQGDPVNIRPATWYSDLAQYPAFKTRRDFVNALNSVIGMANVDTSIQRNWLKTVEQNYLEVTGNQI